MAILMTTLKIRNVREQRKPASVRRVEQSMPSKKECTFARSSEYTREVIKAEPVLCSLYGSKRYERLDHDNKKAGRGEFDVATNALLRMAGGHIGRKRMPGEDVLLRLGLVTSTPRRICPRSTFHSELIL
jgi:hypothetical protein